MRNVAIAAALALPVLGACSKKTSPADDAAAPITSASVSVQGAAPCNVVTTIAIDKGARLETGLTVSPHTSGKVAAVGYASGDGTPKVVTVDDSGNVAAADVDWSAVKGEAKTDPALKRHIFRVTPLGLRGTKMRAGVDFLDSSDKPGTPKELRCGPADQAPLVDDTNAAQFDQPSEADVAKMSATSDDAVDYRDCRTFGTADHPWVLATQVKREGPGANHNLLYSWVVADAPGKAKTPDAVVDKRTVKPAAQAYPKVEHFVAPTVLEIGDGSYVLAARDQGNLVLARRGAHLEKTGTPESLWLGAAAGMPSLAHQGGHVLLATTEWQKTDLYASAFAEGGTFAKPAKVAITDATPHPDGSRESAGVDAMPGGDVFVVFVDGKAPSRQARLAVLGGDLKQKVPAVFDVTPATQDVGQAEVVTLADKKALVLTIDASGTIGGAIVTCKY